jgi:hypothetical protein
MTRPSVTDLTVAGSWLRALILIGDLRGVVVGTEIRRSG